MEEKTDKVPQEESKSQDTGQSHAETPLEKAVLSLDGLKVWLSKSIRIGMLLAKGGYLVRERKRLLVKLGQEVYDKIAKGELRDVQLEPLVQHLDRVSKKIEIEEMLVRSLRFGKKGGRTTPKANEPPPEDEPIDDKTH